MRRQKARRRVARFLASSTIGVVGSLGAVGWLGAITAVHGVASSDMSLVARVALPSGYGADASGVVIDPVNRRAAVALGLDAVSGHAGSVVSYDLDSFKPVGSAPHENVNPKEWAVDPFHGHVFVGGANAIDVYDETGQTPPKQYLLPSAFSGDQSWGMAYSSKDDILYVVTGPQSRSFSAVAIDASNGHVLWQDSPQGCSNGIANTAGELVGLSLDGTHLYTFCQLQAAYINGLGGAQGSGAVMSLQLPPDSRNLTGCVTATGACLYNGTVQLYAGIVTGTSGADAIWIPGTPQQPIERVFAVVPSGAGWASYIFDTHTQHFVGAPTLFQPAANTNVHYDFIGFGADQATGRVFTQDSAYTLDGRQPDGTLCQNRLSSENTFQITEAATIGNASYGIPTGDPKLSTASVMGYDPVRQNLWIYSLPWAATPCNSGLHAKQSEIDVYHVGLPPAQIGSRGDPDTATSNIPEAAGLTSANAGAQASAYGVRYEMAPSGVEGPLTFASTGTGTLTCSPSTLYTQILTAIPGLPALSNPPQPPQYTAFCHAGTRRATFAEVPAVSLDAAEVRAQAIAGETDRASAQDLETASNVASPGPTVDSEVGYVLNAAGQPDPQQCMVKDPTTGGMTDRCAVPSQVAPYVSGQALPYRPAACDDSGSSPGLRTADNSVQIGQPPPPSPSASPSPALTLPVSAPGAASAQCSFTTGAPQATGQAQSNQASLGLPISVHDTSASASVSRTSAQGSVASAVSTAHGINIAGLVQIGRLQVTATVSAHGRPGTAHTTYDCEVSGLNLTPIPGLPAPSVPQGTMTCAQAQGYVDQLQINSTFTGRLSIEFPTAYDNASTAPLQGYGVVRQATPRGYLAQVQKSPLNQIQDSILTSAQDVEEPALVITEIVDTTQERNRLVATFGGVATTATYGIFPLNQDFSGPDSGGAGGLVGGGPDTGVVAPAPGGTEPGNAPAAPPSQRNVAAHPPTGIGAVAQAIVDGFRFLAQHPGLIPALVAVWLLFAAPGYLLARRRTLLAATGGV